jgi:hypothetical protein
VSDFLDRHTGKLIVLLCVFIIVMTTCAHVFRCERVKPYARTSADSVRVVLAGCVFDGQP